MIYCHFRLDKDDRYNLKCVVDGTNDTNVNQGSVNGYSLPSNADNPVSIILYFRTLKSMFIHIERFAVEATQSEKIPNWLQLDHSKDQ